MKVGRPDLARLATVSRPEFGQVSTVFLSWKVSDRPVAYLLYWLEASETGFAPRQTMLEVLPSKTLSMSRCSWPPESMPVGAAFCMHLSTDHDLPLHDSCFAVSLTSTTELWPVKFAMTLQCSSMLFFRLKPVYSQTLMYCFTPGSLVSLYTA